VARASALWRWLMGAARRRTRLPFRLKAADEFVQAIDRLVLAIEHQLSATPPSSTCSSS
jgi:hypothetical protein